MRTGWSLVASVAVVVALAGGGIAIAERSGHVSTGTSSASAASAVSHAAVDLARVQSSGGATGCGSLPGATPAPKFTLPANAHTYTATLAVSMRYRTFGPKEEKKATFTVAPQVAASVSNSSRVVITPSAQPLLQTHGRFATASFVSRVSSLSGGTVYVLDLRPHYRKLFCLGGDGRRIRAGITFSHVVYAVHAWSK